MMQGQYLKQLHLRLQNLSPKKVLERGYSITYIDGRVVKNPSGLKEDQKISTELFKGKIISKITEIEAYDQEKSNL